MTSIRSANGMLSNRQKRPLFPSRAKCQRRIQNFSSQYKNDSEELALIWDRMVQDQSALALREIQEKVVTLLRKWRAYRNQPARRNEQFLRELSEDIEVTNALFQIVTATQTTGDMLSILEEKKSIEKVYGFLKRSMLIGAPARIVTVSKALLMIAGFTPGLDSKVLGAIKYSNRDLLACAGVWPFTVYLETLEFMGRQQRTWERECNLRMVEMLPGLPVGQIIDRVLWAD